MARRGSVVTVFMVLAFVLAGYLVYTRIIQQPPQEVTEVVVCGDPLCHNVFEVTFARGKGGGPYECPRCGKRIAYIAFQCTHPDCGAIFPVTPHSMSSGDQILCPVCREKAERLLSIPEDAEALSDLGAE